MRSVSNVMDSLMIKRQPWRFLILWFMGASPHRISFVPYHCESINGVFQTSIYKKFVYTIEDWFYSFAC